MANYILGVETSSSNYKLFKEGSNLEEQTYTKVATLNNLNDSLIGAEETDPIACPASIDVTEGTGEGGAKTYAISIGKDALPETSTATDITATGEGVTLTLNDAGVDKFGATITNPAVGTVTAGETAATATIKGTLSAGWEQGTNKISYKVAATEQTIATIAGLNKDAAAENLTIGTGTITLAKEALPTSGSATITETYRSATGGTFNLKVGDSQPTAVSNEFDKYVIDTSAAKGTLKAKFKAKDYWTGDGTTTITFHAGSTDNSHAIEITGLSEAAEWNKNIYFTLTEENPTITLYEEALNTDTGTPATKSGTKGTLALATTGKNENATAVTAGGEKVETDGIVVTLGNPASEEATTVTATVKQKLTDGWKILETNTNQVVYYKDKTDTLATISNVNKDAKASDFTCAEANNVLTVTMASGALVKDASKPATIAAAEASVTANNLYSDYATGRKLALGEGANAPGTKDDTTNNPIELTVTALEEGSTATTTDAKVIQTLHDGWTLEETNKNKITYVEEKELLLAKIENVKRGAVAGEDISLNDKIITLENGALITDASNTITLTRGSTEAANEGYTDFNTQLNYTLDLGTEVLDDQTATTDYFVTDIKADASPATTYTATISQQMAEYFAVGDNNSLADTKITYTPAKAAATPLATITGLKEGAKISAGTYDADETKRAEDYAADIVVNTVYKTVTLNSGAVPANPVETSTDTPNENATKIAITDGTSSEYNLKLGTGLSAPATDLGKPKAGSAIDNSGNLAIVSTPSKGWASADWNDATRENSEESKSFTYTQPADLTWATIKNLKASAAAANVTVAQGVDSNGKLVVTLQKGALDEAATGSVTIEYDPTNNDDGAVHAFSFALNTTEGTDDDKVAVFGASTAAKTTPKLIVEDADSQESDEPSGTKTAKIVVYDSAGWEVGTDETSGLPTVTFHKDDVPVVLAKVVNLAENATVDVDEDGTLDNITFTAASKEIKLSKAALQQESDDYETSTITAGDYDVSLVASDKIAGYQESLFGGYNLATDEDVKAAGISYKSENLATDVTVTVDGGTATITGTLNQGWSFDANDANVLKFTPANDTATLATITNLSTDADDTNISLKAELNANDEPTGKVIIALAKGAFVFNDDDSSDGTADADTPVKLTNERDGVSNFKLTLTDGTDTLETFGFEENYSWAVDGTTAKYNQANEEGWKLTTTGDKPNMEVVYKARVDPETATSGVTNLISINNLASGLTVDTMTTDGGDTITAVGTWDESTDTFTPGLWVSKDYVPANEDNNEPETEGALTISRNVLGTSTSTFTLTDSKYEISLNDDTDKNLYVLQKTDFGGNPDSTENDVVDKYYWTYNPTSGSTGYYKTTPAYWTFDDTAKTITYTAPKSATQVLQLSGVAKGLQLGNYDDYYNINASEAFTSNVIIGGSDSFDETDNTTTSLINVTPYVEDDPTTEGDQSVLGTVTFSQDALGETKVTLGNTNKKLYTLELEGVTAPSFDSAAWSVDGTTATYKADITAGHTLTDKADDGSFKSISYTAAGSAKDIAVITGLKSGLAVESGEITGITVTDNVIKLGEEVLGTSPSIKLANKTNTQFSLALGDGIPDYAIDDENNKKKIEDGADVWRLNNTTAAFKHIIPAHYTTKDDVTINYTGEATKATYVTVYNLKSGLVEEDGKILAQAGDTNELLSTEAADSENPGVITVKQGALGTTTVTLTNGKDTENKAVKYTFNLDNVTAVEITGTPTWTVANGTATYTGNLTEGWGLTSNETNIKYYAAKTGKNTQVLATITNLKSDVTDKSLIEQNGIADTAMTGTFLLKEDLFDAKDVKLTNNTLDDGTELDYSININADLATKTTAAETGDKRWYFDKEASTTLNYGVVHDAYYKRAAADATTIEYIEEEQEDPISQITNLAEGLKLNESDPTYFLETADGKYYKTEGTAPVTGITVNYSAKTVTPTAAVLGKDAKNPTEVKNTLNSFNLKFVQDASVQLPQAQNLLNLDSAGSKLTLYNAKGEGYEFTQSKITYVEAQQATDANTIATVSGFKSGLVKDTASETQIGTYSNDATPVFTAAITLDIDNTKFIVKQGAVDTENKNTVITVADGAKGKDYKLALDSDYFKAANNNIPQDANGWIYSSGTATFNKGKTAGWAIPADGTNKGKVVYLAANFATDGTGSNTLATVTGLKKSGLAVSADGQQITDTKTGNAAVTADTTTTANTVDVKLTSYALNKADVQLKKGTAAAAGATYKFSLDSDAKITQGGVEVDNPGYVAGKTVQHIWTKVKDNNKATYTVKTTEGYNADNNAEVVTEGSPSYDARVVYTKTSNIATTITGIKESLVPTGEGNDNTLGNIAVNKTDEDGHVGTITVTKADLVTPADTVKEFKIKLANGNGNNYELVLGDASTSTGKRWHVKNGTATYVDAYEAKSYVESNTNEITYTRDAKNVTLATVTGLNKTLAATDDKGVDDATAATTYGIKAISNFKVGTKEEKTTDPSTGNETTTTVDDKANVIALGDRTKLATGTVTLKNGTGSDYRLAMTKSDFSEAEAFTATEYENGTPLLTYNKGTLTLAIGTGESWDYTVKNAGKQNETIDYNSLTYKKAAPFTVATVKGLNTTLKLNDNKLYNSTGDTQVVTLGTGDGISADPYEIKLTSGALFTTPKNNTKITLTLPKANARTYQTVYQYTLEADSIGEATDITSDTIVNTDKRVKVGDRVWSIEKGAASYQYDTSAGWTFAEDGKTVTYTTKKTNVLAKINGVSKDWTTNTTAQDGTVTKATAAPDAYIIGSNSIKYSDIIEIAGDKVLNSGDTELQTDNGDPLITFTLKNSDYLALGKVSITTVDKSGTKYYVLADESLKSTDYDPKWTVKGSAGTATLTSGKTKGYSNAYEEGTSKYGTAVNYTAEKVSTTFATVKGLKKDDKNETDPNKLLETLIGKGALTFNTATQTIGIDATKGDILGETTVSITNGKDPDTKQSYSYTFDENISGTDINTDIAPKFQIKANSGVVNVVRESAAEKFTLSLDKTKLEYNKTAKDTILATVKGLNKELNVNADNKVVVGTGTDEVVKLQTSDETGIITLFENALADANVSFSQNKALEEGTYSVVLDNGVKTDSNAESNINGWSVSKGTATYKNYNEGYYKVDNKGGYTYVKERNNYIYATISGLNTTLTDVSSFDATNYGGEITITDAMLVNDKKNNVYTGKNVTLSNKTANGITAKFTLKLADNLTQESSLDADTKFVKGKLTGTQTAGYLQASDTSITYLAKAKENQLIATLSGINTNKDVSVTGASKSTGGGTIALTKDNLTNDKGVTLNKTVTLTTTDLAAANKLDYTISGVSGVTTSRALSGTWGAVKSNTATFTGLATAAYTLEDSNKSVTYTKAIGTPADGTNPAKPATVMTVKNITAIDTATANEGGVTVTGNVSGKAATMSNGIIPVTFKNTNNIVGSNDADQITVVDTGASVKGGKGDDSITLGTGKDTVLYANGDGFDTIVNFDATNDVIKLTGGKLTSVIGNTNSTVIKVGTGSITLNGDYTSTTINIYDSKGTTNLWGKKPKTATPASSDVLFEDNNYSADAAALSDIVEPFKASYTPYDFEAGLDLVKQNSLAPAVTFTGEDKK